MDVYVCRYVGMYLYLLVVCRYVSISVGRIASSPVP